MMTTTNYVEVTGPLTRVGILVTDEDNALELAREELGTTEYPCVTDSYEWGFEFGFDNGYLY